MRALGYLAARDPGEGAATSVEQQRQAFEEYCLREGHRAVATFHDHLSPTQDDRPGYQEMVAFIQGSSEGFLVVVAEASVLGDTLEEVVTRLLALDALGAQVLCMDSQLPDPLQNALHHFQSARIRDIKGAMTAKALQGEGLGKPPYGYHIDPAGRLEVVPHEAQVVEHIFHLYTEEGLGIRRITRLLNTSGTLTRSGGQWNVVAVMDILKNPAYLGTYQRFGFRIPRNHPNIIAPALFRKAQDLMRSRRVYRRRAQAEPFLLSGLVYCGFCGARMMGVTRRQTWHRKDGTRRRGLYRYYQCQARANQSLCDYRTRRAPELEEQVVAVARSLLLARREEGPTRETVEGPHLGPDQGAASARAAQRGWHRRWLQAVRHTAEGGMSLAHLRLVMGELARERSSLASIEMASSPSLDEEAILEGARWESLDFPQRQGLLRHLVQRVTVTEGECQVLLR